MDGEPQRGWICPWCGELMREKSNGRWECPGCRRGAPPGYLGLSWMVGQLNQWWIRTARPAPVTVEAEVA